MDNQSGCRLAQLPVDDGEHELDEDWCLMDMGRSVVEGMRRDIAEGRMPYDVELAPGVTVSVVPTGEEALERLSAINELSQFLSSEHGVDPRAVRRKMLTADGWILARGRLLSPLWMCRCTEVTFADLARMGGYEWVAEAGGLQ